MRYDGNDAAWQEWRRALLANVESVVDAALADAPRDYDELGSFGRGDVLRMLREALPEDADFRGFTLSELRDVHRKLPYDVPRKYREEALFDAIPHHEIYAALGRYLPDTALRVAREIDASKRAAKAPKPRVALHQWMLEVHGCIDTFACGRCGTTYSRGFGASGITYGRIDAMSSDAMVRIFGVPCAPTSTVESCGDAASYETVEEAWRRSGGVPHYDEVQRKESE